MQPQQAPIIAMGKLRDAWRDARPYIYPVGISLWVALIFTERFVFDELASAQAKSVWSALPLATVFVLVPAWVATSLALLASRRTLRHCLRIVGNTLWQVLKNLWSPYLLVFTAVVLFLLKLANVRELIASLRETLKALGGQLPDRYVIAALCATGACFLALFLAHRFFKEKKTTAVETMRELIISAYFILANAAVYILVYEKFIMAKVPVSIFPGVFAELIKDTAIYSIVALAIVVGTFKAQQPLRVFKRPFDRGVALAAMVLATIICAAPALALDVLFIDKVEAGRSVLYPMPEQRHLIRFHIMFRDFVLLVPLIVAAFLRLFLEIVKLNAESRSRRARAIKQRRRAGFSGEVSSGTGSK